MRTRAALQRWPASVAAALLATLSVTAAPLPAVAGGPSVTIGTVHGVFYANPANSGGFDPATLPASASFTKDFPVIAFNSPPAQQVCSNATSVNTGTRPFTDVVPSPDGTCSTIVAEGNGVQAGTTLFTFEAAFTANLTVAGAGDVTFNVLADDGWVLAAGPSAGSQPTFVAGSLQFAPASGFATKFPVVGAFNGISGPTLRPVTVHFPAAGVYPIEVDYSECCGGDLVLLLGTDQALGPILPTSAAHRTLLSYTGATHQDFDDPASLAALLVDASTNPSAPLPNQTVTFNLGGQTCSAITDQAGTAACTIVPSESAGTVALTASFSPAAGSPFVGATAATTLTVTPEEAAVQYIGPTVIANGRGVTMSAALKEDGTVPIAGRTITMAQGTAPAVQSCSGVTDTTGTASCTIATVNQPLGPGTVAPSFAGDSFYLPAGASSSTIVFEFLASGAFVMGNQSADIRTPVTFWSAMWSTLNSLSGGPAPASFKGFAQTTSGGTCGGPWSTDTGNSSGPPASLPSFMAVPVASSIGQSGSIVSGNVTEIVIVQTNPGYMPDPGDPGTGTIVAVLCP